MADGRCVEGDEGLVAQWRAAPGSRLWLDIEGAPCDDHRSLLLGLGCEELAIGDAFRRRHPPKVEPFDNSTFILFRGISRFDDSLELEPQQVALWVGEDFLLSYHEAHSLSITHFRESEPRQKLLQEPRILALRMLHYASGRYLEGLLAFENHLGELEDSLLAGQSSPGQSEHEMKELVGYRSRLRKLRRIFSYHERLAAQIVHTGTAHLGEGADESYHVRRDLHDRCERLLSLCSLYYEICGDLVEGYISVSSHNLNQTMKVLTIITAIFVPLGFLAGLYGMNFDHMPELHWKYAYFALLGVMGLLAAIMLLLFRRIRWL
jgi:magnesium transporter